MKRGILLLLLGIGTLVNGFGQTLFDTFSDGNFTASPVWGGSTSLWTIVTTSDVSAGATNSYTLRLASSGPQTDYLSSQIASWGDIQEWGFWIGRRAQAFTAVNQQYFWLYANEATLTSATVDGYRIAIGDDSGGDDIRIEYIVNGAVSSTIFTSSGSVTNGLTDIGFLVRVTRSAAGLWTLYSSTLPSANGTGAIATDIPNSANTNVSQGSTTNNSLVPSSNGYIGVAALHTSGANAIACAEFDQIYFTPTSTPNIALSDNGTQVTAADVNQGTTGRILHQFQLAVTTAYASLTGMTCTTGGTYASSDLTNLKVRYSTDATLDAGDATLSTLSSVSTAGSQTFPSFSAQTINAGSTGYIFITSDIASNATHNNTISVSAITTSNLTFTIGNKSGSTTDGGVQTIKDVSSPLVNNYNPADNATGVAVDANLILTFNENVQAGTSGNYVIYNSDNSVFESIPFNDGRVSYSSNIVTINPNTDFSYGLSYYVQISNTAIKDVAGNTYTGISDATTWNFTAADLAADIIISDNGTQVGAANVLNGTSNHILHKFKIDVSTNNATLTGMTCTSSGTYVTADIANLKVRYSSDNALDAGDATLSTLTSPGTAGSLSFPSFQSQLILVGSTGYIFITSDIASNSTSGHTVSINAITTSNLSFLSANKSGSTTSGGSQTIYKPEPTNQPSGFAKGSVTTTTLPVTWTAAVAGSQAPDGYQLVLNSGTVTDPADGTDPGAGSQTINAGSAQYQTVSTGASFSSATPGTMYNIKIYSYTNAGSLIDFNLTSPPTLNVATLPNVVTSPGFSATGPITADITWSAASGYDNTNHSTLVFLKQGSAITAGSPTNSPSTYTANTIFTSGTQYQGDNSAYCIYNGDGTSVSVSGLGANTAYYLLIYTVVDASNSDGTNSYSSVVVTNGTTNNLSAPAATSGTEISPSGFTANWVAANGASSYRLDVATNSNFIYSSDAVAESFENSITAFTKIGGAYYSGSTTSSDVPASTPYYTLGSYGLGNSNSLAVLTSNNINTSDYSNLQLTFKVAAISYNSPGNGIDPADSLTVEISPNGGTTYYNTLQINGPNANNANWAYSATGNATTAYDGNSSTVLFTPAGGGTRTTDGYSTVTITDLPSIPNLKVKISLRSNATAERWVIDDFKVTGNLSTFVSGYNDLSVSGTSKIVSGLTNATNYYYRVRAVGGNSTSSNSNTITVTTAKIIQSKSSGNWNTASTWNPESVPTSIDSVIVKNSFPVTVDVDGECSGLTVESGSTLTISDTKSLNVNTTLANNGTLNCGLSSGAILGNGAFVLADNSTLVTANPSGINASISLNGSKSLSTSANYTFSGTSAQVTGTLMPTTVNSLTIDNAAGVTMSNSTLNVSGVLTINPGKKFEIGVDKRVTAANITNDGGTAGLVIKSNASGTGSLKSDETGVNATVERYIPAVPAWSDGSSGWHLVSSPVVTESIGGSWTPSLTTPNRYDFFKWEEAPASGNWLNQKVPANNISSFSPGAGYLVAYETAVTQEFTDVLNAESVAFSPLTHTTGNQYAGYHLLGNPYPCAIDWNTGSWVKTNVGSFPQVWNSTAKSYKVIAGDGIIPAMNGFMIYVGTGGGALTIPSNSKVHSDSAWYKNTKVIENSILLSANDLDQGGYQETTIRFSEHGQPGFDMGEDCQFMAGYAPYFYTKTGNMNLALSTLPQISSETQVPLYFEKNNSTRFSINLQKSGVPAQVFLTDLKTNQTTNLTLDHSYSFTAEASDNPNRFMLHFSHVGTPGPALAEPLQVFTQNNEIIIANPAGTLLKGDVLIYNMVGQLVFKQLLGDQGQSKVRIKGFARFSGYYIVKVVTEGNTITRKIFIERIEY